MRRRRPPPLRCRQADRSKRGGMSVRPSGRADFNLHRMNTHTFQIRVPCLYDDAKEALLAYTPTMHPCFIFQHTADATDKRTHCHAYYFNNTVKRKFFCEKLTKTLKLNGDYESSDSCSKEEKRQLDLSGAWCYGSKWGTIAPSFIKNISPDIVEQLTAYSIGKRPKDLNKPAVVPSQNHHKNNEDSSLFSIWLKQALADKTLEPHQNTQKHWEHKINSYYLSQNKPYPRVADCRRYAASIRDICWIQKFNKDIFHVVMNYTEENSKELI